VLRPVLLLSALLAALALVACGGKDKKSASSPAGTTSSTPAVTPPAASKAGCEKLVLPKPRPPQKLPKPTSKLDAGQTYQAVVDTSCGSFTIALDVEHAPKTTASFASLARRGFYDGLTFHRISQGFVIQGGDPQGTGNGGPGYKVVETPPSSQRYTRGVVAMAKTEIEDPGTSGSQFFVVTAEDAQLGSPPAYAVVGKVTKGQDVVDRIGVVRADPQSERPLEPIVIRSIRIVESKAKK
jgi:cyclophilin family peptidyl-prolyl cis-trans isomerase